MPHCHSQAVRGAQTLPVLAAHADELESLPKHSLRWDGVGDMPLPPSCMTVASQASAIAICHRSLATLPSTSAAAVALEGSAEAAPAAAAAALSCGAPSS